MRALTTIASALIATLPPSQAFQIITPKLSPATSQFSSLWAKKRNINLNEYDGSDDDFDDDDSTFDNNINKNEENDGATSTNGEMTEAQLRWLQQRSDSKRDSSGKNDVSYSNLNTRETEAEASERLSGTVNIPKTGISVSDEMNDLASKEKYVSNLVPLANGNGLALIETISQSSWGEEPLRYLVPLDAPSQHPAEEVSDEAHSDAKVTTNGFAMIDVPPFSEDLAQQINTFLENQPTESNKEGKSEKASSPARLETILVTCRDGIHYNEAPAVYVTRTSDLKLWKKAFPSVKVITYRLDTPRDVKDGVDQMLDGYGPWAWNGETDSFIETGRPLTRMEWDDETQARVLDEGLPPPDENEDEDSDEDLYTPQAIRNREKGKSILAIYTPGHTYGSITYIFPRTRVCCSGYTLPVEDTRSSSNNVAGSTAGPALDYRGYVTTNVGDWERQMESARTLVQTYSSSFDVVLPSKGAPIRLKEYEMHERTSMLMDMIEEFAELGKVYSQMGII
jgi:hypothetical protein